MSAALQVPERLRLGRPTLRAQLRVLEVGQSTVIEPPRSNQVVRVVACELGKAAGRKFVTRAIPEGTFVGRIA